MKKLLLLPLLLLAGRALAQRDSATLVEITPLKGHSYLYVTYGKPDDKTWYPANSLFVRTPAGIVLLDTPWDDEQADTLVNQLEARFHEKVVACISTHWHADRVGGVKALGARGIPTYASAQTVALCVANGKTAPAHAFTKDTTFRFGGTRIQTFYPGPGHTTDNIVIWVPGDQVLFAGCFLKSGLATGIGYTGDADLQAWPASIRKTEAKFPKARIIVPGHESLEGNAYERTLELIEKAGKP